MYWSAGGVQKRHIGALLRTAFPGAPPCSRFLGHQDEFANDPA